MNPEKLNLAPVQRVQYLGTVIDDQTFRAFLSRERIDKLMSLGDEFLSSRLQPASTWLTLLGTLSSLSHLVPRGRLRMRALQLTVHRSWYRLDDSFWVSWSNDCLQDLVWWLEPKCLLWGVSLSQLSPVLDLWSDASDVSWSAHLGPEVVSGLWSQEATSLSINTKKLLAVERGFLHFRSSVIHSTVCRQLHSRGLSSQHKGHSISSPQFHCPAYPQMVRTLPCPPGSPLHPVKSQCSGRLSLSPGPDPRVKVDSPHGGLSGALPTMAGNDRPVCCLSKSLLLHLFFALPRSSGDGDRRSPTVLGPLPGLRVPSLGCDSTGPPQAPIVVRSCADSDCPVLASEALVSGSAGPSDRPTGNVASLSRSPQPTSLSSSSSRSPQASSSCLETLQRFARAAGFSSRVAAQVGLARRSSSSTNYQLKWSVYRQWCRSVGPSISRPSLPKVSNFLPWLRRSRKLLVSSVMGYSSMLATVFRFKLPSMSSDPVLHDLVRSFRIEASVRPLHPPAWDLSAVLQFLNSCL